MDKEEKLDIMMKPSGKTAKKFAGNLILIIVAFLFIFMVWKRIFKSY